MYDMRRGERCGREGGKYCMERERRRRQHGAAAIGAVVEYSTRYHIAD
jgi:hypothetical protein